MLQISFNFDELTKAVTNIKVVTVSSKLDSFNLPLIELDKNKLILSTKAIELLELKINDRVAINYEIKDGKYIPIISKATDFIDENAGNKLKSNCCISFRGEQRQFLSQFGSCFILELVNNKFQMLPYNIEPKNNQINNFLNFNNYGNV